MSIWVFQLRILVTRLSTGATRRVDCPSLIHRLINGLQAALAAYMEHDAPALGPLLRASRKGWELTAAGMTVQSITERVRFLGARLVIEGLSAHDLRHTWATMAARNGTPIDRLMDAGGWASPAMPLRYVEAAKIANEGVLLD